MNTTKFTRQQKALFAIITLIPITILILLVLFVKQPSSEELVAILEGYYEKYGYFIVFAGAFIESFLLINIYLPGSTTVFLGVILATKGILSFPIIVITGILGVMAAYVIDYLLGKHGWYKLFVKYGLSDSIENAKKRLQEKGKWAAFVSCVHPNYGAISATAAGVLHFDFQKFLLWFLVAQSFWTIFWGLIVFTFGAPVFDVIVKYSTYVIVTLITLWTVKRLYSLAKN